MQTSKAILELVGSISNLLDQLPIGLILINREGRVLTMNRAAREILAQADGVTIEDNRLAAASSRETMALRKLVGQAASVGDDERAHAGGAMALSRPSMLRPLPLLVSPLRPNGIDLSLQGGERPTAAVFVSNPDHLEQYPPEVVARFYGLTLAEARLARALVNGERLGDAARSFHVSLNTVRTQLKSVFLKTGTNRQTDLVNLVLRSPAIIRLQDGYHETGDLPRPFPCAFGRSGRGSKFR